MYKAAQRLRKGKYIVKMEEIYNMKENASYYYTPIGRYVCTVLLPAAHRLLLPVSVLHALPIQTSLIYPSLLTFCHNIRHYVKLQIPVLCLNGIM